MTKLIKKSILKFNIGGRFIPKADGGLDFGTIFDFYNKLTEGGLNKKLANRLMKLWYGKGRSNIEALYNQDLEAYNTMNDKIRSVYSDFDEWDPKMLDEYRKIYKRNPDNIGFTDLSVINPSPERTNAMESMNTIMDYDWIQSPAFSVAAQQAMKIGSEKSLLDDLEGPAPSNNITNQNQFKGKGTVRTNAANGIKWKTQLKNYNNALISRGLDPITEQDLADIQLEAYGKGDRRVDGLFGRDSFNLLNSRYNITGLNWDDIAYTGRSGDVPKALVKYKVVLPSGQYDEGSGAELLSKYKNDSFIKGLLTDKNIVKSTNPNLASKSYYNK